MGFRLTEDDEAVLEAVHPDLVQVVRRAAEIAPFQFYVNCGARSVEAQKENIKKGVSKTMASRHILAPNGYAHAVDLIPEYRGKWEHANWEAYYPLGDLMRKAAIFEGIPIEWGAVWDRKLNDLKGDCKAEVMSYTGRMKALGKKAFLDGPHFQLPKRDYPDTANVVAALEADDELAPVTTESPSLIAKEPPLIKEVKNELRDSGSRTIKEGDKITTTGKVVVGIGAGTTVGKETGLFEKLGEWANHVSSSKYLLSLTTKMFEFIFSRWYIVLIALGLVIWQSGYRVKFFRAQDSIEGKN